MCGENRERKRSLVQSKQEDVTSTGAAFVCDDKEEGGVTMRWTLFFASRLLAYTPFRSWARLGGDKSVKAAKL